MIDPLGYLISSHTSYQGPLSRLLESMAAIAPGRIVVVEGGHAHADRRTGFRIVHVPHNSFDYTALIDLVEHPAQYPAWSHVFLLHDTMELGANSDALIRDADPALDCVAVWGGECNLCLYRVDYLMRRRDDLLALKDCTKLRAVEVEGFLWRTLPEDRRGSYPGGIDIDYAEAVYGGVERMRVHYTGVDILKHKANWGQAWPPNVVTP